jgi:ribA/ribD-fused uncharacterized protein
MVLSNFYPCDIQYNQHSYNSVEQGFQHTKAIALERQDIADKIMNTSTGSQAKKAAEDLNEEDECWNIIKAEVMNELIKAKIKCCEEFKNALIESGDKVLAEATSNIYWASGLSPELTACTKPEFFPGKNVLGKILSEARQSLVQKHAEINVKASTINPFLLPNQTNEVEISEKSKIHGRTPYKILSRDRRSSSVPNRKSDL